MFRKRYDFMLLLRYLINPFFAVITTYPNYVILKRFKEDPEVRKNVYVIKRNQMTLSF